MNLHVSIIAAAPPLSSTGTPTRLLSMSMQFAISPPEQRSQSDTASFLTLPPSELRVSLPMVFPHVLAALPAVTQLSKISDERHARFRKLIVLTPPIGRFKPVEIDTPSLTRRGGTMKRLTVAQLVKTLEENDAIKYTIVAAATALEAALLHVRWVNGSVIMANSSMANYAVLGSNSLLPVDPPHKVYVALLSIPQKGIKRPADQMNAIKQPPEKQSNISSGSPLRNNPKVNMNANANPPSDNKFC
ncbi:hypothetical protein EV359DRAFT_86936 [Lentinula novae-zelandiae]|nr:hypothetical protein EV359DRAFT_86936 [Lentinula novae-zelandiae]